METEMAKRVQSNHGEIDAEKLRTEIGRMLAAEGAAAVLKVEAAILMCEGIRDGIFKGDNAAIGIEVYGLSGAPNTSEEERKTFKAQASKLSAVVKTYRNWKEPTTALRVLNDAAKITNKGWNKFVSLNREIVRNYKDKPAPSHDEIMELTVKADDDGENEKTLADYAVAAFKALEALATKATEMGRADGKLLTAMEYVDAFRSTAGETLAEIKAKAKVVKTGADRIAELRAAANAKRPVGAAVN